MADEQIIVNIKVNSDEVNQAKGKINQLTDSIESLSNTISEAKKQNNAYKAAQNELTKAYEAQTISVDKWLTETDKLNAKISTNNKIIGESSILLSKEKSERNANIKLINSEVGAYTNLSNEYSIAAKKAKDLAVVYGINSKQAKEAALAANTLNDQLKEIDSTVGLSTRRVGDYAGGVQGLKMELREMKGILLSAKEGSEEYNTALKRSAELADNLGDMQDRIKGSALDFDGVMNNTTKIIGGVANGYQALQGAQALFGKENEDLQKTLIKIQAAMALAQGIEGMGGMFKAMRNLKDQVVQFTIVQKISEVAQRVWNAAMSANPIGIVIGAIAVLVGAISGLYSWYKKSEAATLAENTAMDGLVTTSKEAAAAHNEHIKVMQELTETFDVATGKLTEHEKKILDIREAYSETLAAIKEETKEKLDDVNGFWHSAWRKIKADFTFSSVEGAKVKELTDVYIAENRKIIDAKKEANLKIFQEKYLNTQKEIDADKKASAEYKKIIEDTKNKNIKAGEEARKIKEANAEKLAKIDEEAADRSLENFRKQNDEVVDLNNGFIEEQKVPEAEKYKAFEELNKEYQASLIADNEAYKEIESLNNDWEIKAKKEKAQKIIDIEKQKELDIQEFKKDIIISFADETANFLTDLEDQKTEEKINKIKDNKKIQEDLLKNQLENGIISETEYSEKITALNKKSRIEEAKANKKKTLFDIAINTVNAVIKTFANHGWPEGILPGAAVAAAGAIQAGFVAAKPLPTYAKGTNNIVTIGDSHASGNDVSVWGYSGNKKQFFGKVEKGEAMPVIRKSAANDYLVSKLNGKYSPNNMTFANGTNDIMNNGQAQNNDNINSLIAAFSNIKIVAKIEDITKQANRKMEIVSNSKI